MLRQYGVSPLASGDRRLDDIVYALAGSGEGLTMLGRVLEHAAVRAKSGRVDHAAVLRAMRSDLSWLAAGVEYRGARLTEKALRQWLKQFPDDLQAVALQLVRSVAKDYFIGARDYFLALDHLIHESGVPRDAAVSFCVWQHVGTSAPAVAHRLKNQAKWRRLPDVDLRADPARWPDFPDAPPDAFLLVDDVVGTGNTLRKLIAGPASPVAELLRRFPRAQLRILVIAAFDEAIRLVRADLSEFRDRAALIPSRLLGRRDLCFSKESRILPNPAHRDRLAAFCRGNAGNRIRLGRSMRLGYQGLGAALVLHDTVPNFTLPLLWYESETWRPLFPAAGLTDDR
jgi:hypothetical protein